MTQNVSSVNSSSNVQPAQDSSQPSSQTGIHTVTYHGRTYTYTQEEIDQGQIRQIVGGCFILLATTILGLVSGVFWRP